MKQFGRTRSIEEIDRELVKRDFPGLDIGGYDKGGDWVFGGMFIPKTVKNCKDPFGSIMINMFNGNFTIFDGKRNIITNNASEEFENEDWFQDALNIVYEPLDGDE